MDSQTIDSVAVRRLSGAEAAAAVDGLADVLIDCVEGGAGVSFMLPIARETVLTFWRKVAEGVARGERVLLVAQEPNGRIVGTAQLVMTMPQNQPHRADVEKVLVHRDARRRGVAQRLMTAIDDAAREEGKSVLVLDTVMGGDAERLYARSGWQRVGDIPNYALKPDGTLGGTTFFHKQL